MSAVFARRGAVSRLVHLSFPKIPSRLKLLHLPDSVDSLPTMNCVLASIISTLLVAFRSRLALQAEILALRHQLNVLRRSADARRHLRTSDRVLWVWLSRLWPDWRSALLIVKPETVIRWHRRGFRLYWRWKSRGQDDPMPDRFYSSRMPGSRNHPECGITPPDTSVLYHLLPRFPLSSIARQGFTGNQRSSATRQRHRRRDSKGRGASTSLRTTRSLNTCLFSHLSTGVTPRD